MPPRKQRTYPDIELKPERESIVGATSTTTEPPATAEKPKEDAPSSAPTKETSHNGNGRSVSDPSAASKPAPVQEPAAARRESTAAPEADSGAGSLAGEKAPHEPAADPSTADGTGSSIAVRQDRQIDINEDTQSSSYQQRPNNAANAGFAGLRFDSVPQNAGPLIAPPTKKETKSTAITIRCTEAVREDFRANVNALAAVHRIPVEEVNVFVLMEIMEIFQRVNNRIIAWKNGDDQP
ncbi:hypothetical protein MOQ72_27005 [Saccharopolyspora sp. K220]|uniref:hypothetical protein n=1 Tax=Saccharopolyspora soli TaxID=2926618 RepID=UPI001F56DCED|nr:hypothetical protein [Saccharopolyspora soli]MCI2421098.1 hypothetical protein [Saccharopolyspora soli]